MLRGAAGRTASESAAPVNERLVAVGSVCAVDNERNNTTTASIAANTQQDSTDGKYVTRVTLRMSHLSIANTPSP